jgi:hypothetical protein
MAHKHHENPSRSSRHKHHDSRHHGRDEKPEKKVAKNSQEERAVVAQKDAGPGRSPVGATWSNPIMDPSGQFVYRVMELPNGT